MRNEVTEWATGIKDRGTKMCTVRKQSLDIVGGKALKYCDHVTSTDNERTPKLIMEARPEEETKPRVGGVYGVNYQK